jgi:glycosyltransferase involved in cell wall biosynthesis
MADDIRSKGIPESKISVVTNGCDPEIFRPRENAKEELGWDEETSHIGFVGTLSEWQGVDKVIKALPYIIEKNEKIKFIIVGDGPERDNLEDLVKAQGVESMVEFTGNFPHERVPLYMSAFDVGMNVKHPGIPSSPLKLYEYLACGTPVVGTDNEDFEPLDDDSVGGKANYESPKDIAENIVDVLNRKGPAMSKDARNRAINSSWEKVAEKSLEAAIN